ncbi:hypothetical protein WL39_20555 [Burkholderia ubonensis]|nr:hypothetical protein WL39_20555 [Burkholderia ubonensis]KWB68075.1 hypothetical protein WL38_14300 [Burkholderia ubonensis]
MNDIRADGVGHVAGLREISTRAVERSFMRSLTKREEDDQDGAKIAEMLRRLDGLGDIAVMKELDTLVNEGLLGPIRHFVGEAYHEG